METAKLVIPIDINLARVARVKGLAERRAPLFVQRAEVQLLMKSFKEAPADDHHHQIVLGYERERLSH